MQVAEALAGDAILTNNPTLAATLDNQIDEGPPPTPPATVPATDPFTELVGPNATSPQLEIAAVADNTLATLAAQDSSGQDSKLCYGAVRGN